MCVCAQWEEKFFCFFFHEYLREEKYAAGIGILYKYGIFEKSYFWVCIEFKWMGLITFSDNFDIFYSSAHDFTVISLLLLTFFVCRLFVVLPIYHSRSRSIRVWFRLNDLVVSYLINEMRMFSNEMSNMETFAYYLQCRLVHLSMRIPNLWVMRNKVSNEEWPL